MHLTRSRFFMPDLEKGAKLGIEAKKIYLEKCPYAEQSEFCKKYEREARRTLKDIKLDEVKVFLKAFERDSGDEPGRILMIAMLEHKYEASMSGLIKYNQDNQLTPQEIAFDVYTSCLTAK
jgi:hypothetical protein